LAVSGSATASTVQLLAAALFAIASLRLADRAARADDSFYSWLGAAVALWAASRLNLGLSPASSSDHITITDILRLSAYAVAVVAAGSEFIGYWRQIAVSAVLEERRRIARELHDGLAQELAFISTCARSVATEQADARLGLIARSGERALDESRRAIAALTRPLDEPLDIALAQTAEELGGRLGVRVVLDLEHGIGVSSDTREALLRIAREAITNAGRHGRPSKISVSLANHAGVTMRVADDGRGFRPDDPKVYAGDRFGVVGMRERVEALGGRFALDSRPYGGTRVEVWVP
jgi:signal transduction histidine kinase